MTISNKILEKLDIIILFSLIILTAVLMILIEFWDGIILIVILFGNQLWNEYEKKKLAGKDPITLSKNKMIIMLGVFLTGLGIILLYLSYINRELTREVRFVFLATFLGGISLISHELFKRYQTRSLPLRIT